MPHVGPGVLHWSHDSLKVNIKHRKDRDLSHAHVCMSVDDGKDYMAPDKALFVGPKYWAQLFKANDIIS